MWCKSNCAMVQDVHECQSTVVRRNVLPKAISSLAGSPTRRPARKTYAALPLHTPAAASSHRQSQKRAPCERQSRAAHARRQSHYITCRVSTWPCNSQSPARLICHLRIPLLNLVGAISQQIMHGCLKLGRLGVRVAAGAARVKVYLQRRRGSHSRRAARRLFPRRGGG